MARTTKAALAAELRISKARVSQYRKAGMPGRADGKLDREEALNWIRQNQLSQTFEDKGAHRARRLAEGSSAPTRQPRPSDPVPGAAEPMVNPFDVGTRLSVLMMLRPSALIIASAVMEAGGSLEVAFAATRLAHSPLLDAATLVLHIVRHSDFEDLATSELRMPPEFLLEPDWASLAEAADVSFDPEALQTYLDANPVWDARGDDDNRRFTRDLSAEDVTG